MSGMQDQIEEQMEVVGSCGNHVGTVDHMEGDRIKLTRNDDPDGGNHHHYLPVSAVASVEEGRVVLTMNHMDALKARTME